MAITLIYETFLPVTDGDGLVTGYEYQKSYSYSYDGQTYDALVKAQYDVEFNWLSESFDDGRGTLSYKEITASTADSYTESGGWIYYSSGTVGEGDITQEESYSFNYSRSNDAFLGGSTTDSEGLTTVYDQLWNVVSATRDVTGFEQLTEAADPLAYKIYGGAGGVFLSSKTEQGFGGASKYTTYFNSDGEALGSSDTFTETYDNWKGEQITSSTTTYHDADWNWVGSNWSDSLGNEGWDTRTLEQDVNDVDGDGDTTDLIYAERGESTWTWSGEPETSSYEYFYSYSEAGQEFYDASFLGGTSTSSNGETTEFDANFNVIRTTRDVSSLGLGQLSAADGLAFDLYGDAYFDTTSYTDRWGTSTQFTYYSADGETLGTANAWASSWYDDYLQETVTYVNVSYQDSDWNWLGSEWSDSNGSEGWNKNGLEFDVDDLDGDGATDDKVWVETGYNKWTWSWTDSNDQLQTDSDSDTYTYYYTDDAARQFLGGVSENDRGEITEYDSNWRVVSSTRSISGLELLTSELDSDAFDLFAKGKLSDGTDRAVYFAIEEDSWDNEWGSGSWKETSYYDADGIKLGSRNENINTWFDDWRGELVTSINVSYQDANWHQLLSNWRDDQGNSGSYSKQLIIDSDDIDEDSDTTELIHRELSSNTWSWIDSNDVVYTDSNSSEYFYSYDPNDEYGYYSEFLGGKSTNGRGETTVYDANWNVVSTSRDVSSLPSLSNTTIAYELFALTTSSVIYYSEESNSWSDANGSGSWTETTYYDAEGNKLGSSHTSTNSWTDSNGIVVTSTNANYQDADWNNLLSEWSDTNGNSGWSKNTLVADEDDLDGDGDKVEKIRVEEQENTWTWTWTDSEGIVQTDSDSSSSTYYYGLEEGSDYYGVFLGGTNTYNSEITEYDKDWKVVSRSRDLTDLPVLTSTETAGSMLAQAWDVYSALTAGDIYYSQLNSNSWNDSWGSGTWTETAFYNASGVKIGTVNESYNEWSWDDGNGNTGTDWSTSLNFQDANWKNLRSAWEDSNGNSSWSETTLVVDVGDRDSDGDVNDLVLEEVGGNAYNDGATVVTSTFTYYYSYDPADVNGYYKTFLGGTYIDGYGNETEYGAGWTELRDISTLTEFVSDSLDAVSTKAELLFTPAYFEEWSDASNRSITYFDAKGAQLGSYQFNTNSWTDTDGLEQTNTNWSFNDASWNQLEHYWSNSDGNWNQSILVVDSADIDNDGSSTDYIREESGKNSWTWTDGSGQTFNDSDSYTYYYSYSESDPSGFYKEFLGGKSTDGQGETVVYDENWNEISRTRDITGLAQLSAETHGVAHDIYGAAYYFEKNNSTDNGDSSWSSTDLQFYNSAGTQIGRAYISENAWTDTLSGETYFSANSDYRDGNEGQLRSEWSNRTEDEFGVEISSDSSITVYRIVTDTNDWDKDGLISDKVRVEEQTNTWDNQWGTGSDFTVRYYSYSSTDPQGWNKKFLGAIQTNDTGEETTFDKDWNVVSRKQNIDAISDQVVDLNTDPLAYEFFVDGKGSDGGDLLVYYSEASDTWVSDDLTESNSWTNRRYFNAAGEELGNSNTGTNDYIDWYSENVNYNDAEGNNLYSSWSDGNGSENWNKNSLVVDTTDRDGDGSTTDYIRLEESSNTWLDYNGNPDTNRQEYYYTYDPADPNGFYKEFLGGTEYQSNGQIVEYDKDWIEVSRTQDITSLQGNILTAEIDQTAFDLFGALGTIYFSEEINNWDNGMGDSGSWRQLNYFDIDGNQVGQANFNQNTWVDGLTGETHVSSDFNYRDADQNTLVSEWDGGDGNRNGTSNRLIQDVNDLDGDGDTLDLIREESGFNEWSWVDENGTLQTDSSSWTYYYTYDPALNFWDATFLGGTETNGWDGTINYDANWNRVAGDGYVTRTVEGWNEGSRFSYDVENVLPDGLGNWWVQSHSETRYSTSVAEFSTGENSMLVVTDILTGTVLDFRELAENEKLLVSERSADGLFYIAEVNETSTLATVSVYSAVLGSVDINQPLGESFNITIPAGVRNSAWEPFVKISPPDDTGVGYIFVDYAEEVFTASGNDFIQHRELYSFDVTGKTTLIPTPEAFDWVEISPNPDSQDSGLMVKFGINTDSGSRQTFWIYEPARSEPWISIENNEYWNIVNRQRGQQTLLIRNEEVVFDLLEYDDIVDSEIQRIQDAVEIAPEQYLVKAQYRTTDGSDHWYQRWFVVNQDGTLEADYTFDSGWDRGLQMPYRDDYAYSPDDFDGGSVYFVAHNFDPNDSWNSVSADGTYFVEFSGWNEGASYHITTTGLPTGDGGWWEQGRQESRYSTVAVQLSNGTDRIVRVVDILTETVLDERVLGQDEWFQISERNKDGIFYTSTRSADGTQVTINSFSMALGEVNVDQPISSFVLDRPQELIDAQQIYHSKFAPPSDAGIGYAYVKYRDADGIDQQSIFVFNENTGSLTKLDVALDAHDWAEIVPTLDASDDGFLLQLGGSTQAFYKYDALTGTLSTLSSSGDYWDEVNAYRGQKTIVQVNGTVLFDLLELTDNPADHDPQILNTIALGDGSLLVQVNYSIDDADQEFGYNRWLVVDAQGNIEADVSLDTSEDRLVKGFFRSDSSYFPDDLGGENVYFTVYDNITTGSGFSVYSLPKASITQTLSSLSLPGALTAAATEVVSVSETDLFPDTDTSTTAWLAFSTGFVPASVSDTSDAGSIVTYGLWNDSTQTNAGHYLARIEADGSVTSKVKIANRPEEIFVDESKGLVAMSLWNSEKNTDEAFVVRISDGKLVDIAQEEFETYRDNGGVFPETWNIETYTGWQPESTSVPEGYTLMRIDYADVVSTLNSLNEPGALFRSENLDIVMNIADDELLAHVDRESFSWDAWSEASFIPGAESLLDPSDSGFIIHYDIRQNETGERSHYVARIEGDGTISKRTEVGNHPEEMFFDEAKGLAGVSYWSEELGNEFSYVVRVADGAVAYIDQNLFEEFRAAGNVFPESWEFNEYRSSVDGVETNITVALDNISDTAYATLSQLGNAGFENINEGPVGLRFKDFDADGVRVYASNGNNGVGGDFGFVVSQSTGEATELPHQIAMEILDDPNGIPSNVSIVVGTPDSDTSLGDTSSVDTQWIIGFDGDDTINTSAGEDVMFGGFGNDVFKLTGISAAEASDLSLLADADGIADFGLGADVIELPVGYIFDDNYAVSSTITDNAYAFRTDIETGFVEVVYDGDTSEGVYENAVGLYGIIDEIELSVTDNLITHV